MCGLWRTLSLLTGQRQRDMAVFCSILQTSQYGLESWLTEHTSSDTLSILFHLIVNIASAFCVSLLSLPAGFHFLSLALCHLSYPSHCLMAPKLCYRSPSLSLSYVSLSSLLFSFQHFSVNLLHLGLTLLLQREAGWVMFLLVVVCNWALSPLTSHLCLSSFVHLLPLKPLFIADVYLISWFCFLSTLSPALCLSLSLCLLLLQLNTDNSLLCGEPDTNAKACAGSKNSQTICV